ncbi:hypothetical protein SALB1_0412 [Salinisphaera sp. LB1]|nr:hypothetical protein SALB1_0412 [Salinisphaera sp. LB1]
MMIRPPYDPNRRWSVVSLSMLSPAMASMRADKSGRAAAALLTWAPAAIAYVQWSARDHV